MGRWLLVACAACGRIGFDPASTNGDGAISDAVADGLTVDAPLETIVLKNTSSGGDSSAPNFVLPYSVFPQPPEAGDLAVIAIQQYGDVSISVQSITDDVGSAYFSTGATGIGTACVQRTEIWSSTLAGAATTITVTLSGSAPLAAYSLVFGGTSSMIIGTAVANDHPTAATLIAAPVSPPMLPAAIVTVAASCGAFGTLHAPFTELLPQDSTSAAYDIVTTAGTVGAVWDYGGGTYNTSTVAFH